jgi:hypothetical protein
MSARSSQSDDSLSLSDLAAVCDFGYDRLHDMARTGKLPSAKKKTARVRRSVRLRNGERRTLARDESIIHARLEDVQNLRPTWPGMISLRDVSRMSKIAYETWWCWAGMEACPPLGQKLRTRELLAEAEDGRMRKMPHIKERDYQAIVQRVKSSVRERVIDAEGEWFSPAGAQEEFVLPAWRNVRASLAQMCRCRSRVLGRAINAKEEGYLDRLGRWVTGCVYHGEDLGRLFRRRGPAPSPAPAVPRKGLSDTEAEIVAFVRKQTEPVQGKTIATRLGLPFNSRFRTTLSSLVKRDVLAKSPAGGYVARS